MVESKRETVPGVGGEGLAPAVERLAVIQNEWMGERLEILKEKGLGEWLGAVESFLSDGLMPRFLMAEGQRVGEIFRERGVDLVDLEMVQPRKTTEGAIMEAEVASLKAVFGEGLEEEVKDFVMERVMPLRHGAGEEEEGKGGEQEQTIEPNKFLVTAVENVLTDLLAVAKAFQGADEGVQKASLANLGLSFGLRSMKGLLREDGFCAERMHKEYIWTIRGLRDLPPGSGKEIGELVNRLLERKQTAE